MKFQTIYIIRVYQQFVSKTVSGGWEHYHRHGERELEPHVTLDCREANKLLHQIEKDYAIRGIEVCLELKQYRTGKRKDIEAIEIYKKEKGI
jgi:hypothetical protein